MYVCPDCHWDFGGLGRLGQHLEEARVIQNQRCDQGSPVLQTSWCMQNIWKTKAGWLPVETPWPIPVREQSLMNIKSVQDCFE